MNVGPTYTHVLNEGYAAGVVGRSGEWLSVHSSRLSSRLVFPTPEGAELRAAWLRGTDVSSFRTNRRPEGAPSRADLVRGPGLWR